MQYLSHAQQHGFQVAGLRRQLFHDCQQTSPLSIGHSLDQGGEMGKINTAQHLRYFVLLQAPTTVGNGLVQQAQSIAHAAVRRAGDSLYGGRLRADRLRLQQLLEIAGNLVGQQSPQVEPQTSGQNRDRDFVRIGGRQDELHVRGRLFQSLEQAVKRVTRKHVHFVDDVNLVTAARGRVLGVINQVTDIIHARF